MTKYFLHIKSGEIIEVENDAVRYDAAGAPIINSNEYMLMWTTDDTAKAWNRSHDRIRRIIMNVPGARQHVKSPNVIWLIPAGSMNPSNRPGRPRQIKQ